MHIGMRDIKIVVEIILCLCLGTSLFVLYVIPTDYIDFPVPKMCATNAIRSGVLSTSESYQ